MVKSHYYKHIFRSWHKSHNCATFFFNYEKCRTTRNYNYEIKVVLICLHSVEELKIRHSHTSTPPVQLDECEIIDQPERDERINQTDREIRKWETSEERWDRRKNVCSVNLVQSLQKRTERGFQNHTASTQVLDQLILRSSSSRYSHTIRILCLSTSSETTLCKHPAFKTFF